MRNFPLKQEVKEIWRKPYQLYMRAHLKNNCFSIISSNCVGGILSHDLGQQFRSPTINLTVREFIPFVQRLDYYMSLTPIPYNGFLDGMGGKDWGQGRGYPICTLEDIVLYGVHYHNHDEMISAWEKRKTRINWNNIVIMATDEYVKTQEQLDEFDKLPYPKVLFTKEKNTTYDFQIYILGAEDEESVGDVLRYTGILGIRKFEKYFDCVKWLNDSMECHM